MNNKLILPITFCAYALLLGFTIWHHEMWRDELQPWGIVTHSNSFSDLITNKKYEGHPVLWFALLWLVSKITLAPFSLQVINYVLSLITAWIIIFQSPFSKVQKALVVFGYYFFYEYAAISRDYMLAVVIIISICALWQNAPKHKNWLIILFFLLCFSEMYAAIISVCLAFTLFFQQFLKSSNKQQRWSSLLFPFSAGTGFIISYITTVPPGDSELNYPVNFSYHKDHMIRVLGDFWNAFFPVPKFQEHFWSVPLLYETTTAEILGVILIVIILLQSFPYKSLFIFLVISFLGILSFMYFKYSGYPRHYGHLFIIYICYEWIKRYEKPEIIIGKFQKSVASVFFQAFLIINALVGISFSVADIILPFSCGKQTAQFIRDNFPENITVAGYEDCPASTIANYLGNDVYFLNNLRKSSYIIWTRSRPRPADDVILNNIFFLADSLKSLALVLNHDLNINGAHPLPAVGEEKILVYRTPTGDHQINFKNLAYFGHSMVGDENFYVYEVEEVY